MLEKRKKKKNEYDKVVSTVRGKIESDIRLQNKKSDDDFIDLEKLEISTTKFTVQDDFKSILPALLKTLQEYVTINNEYINIK